MNLPPYPLLNRCLFRLFPFVMNKFFPSKIDYDDRYVEIPEEKPEFEKPIHKRMWRKRFPELVEPFPKISPRYKGWVPNDPLPGEYEGISYRLERLYSKIRFDLRTKWGLKLV